MSYQVLARKWRPKTFQELAGQEHVLQTLAHALDNQRLHHAYLFTGTRGVGKTTIARILAKCLNCEEGVSSTPCDRCDACVEIANGRFMDLIEVDAASRTKVEDTRDLLDNVQYAPGKGRFKVYLIDEVHMLSTHSFNALLKTLEEPPPHVKFLLATTDPQKLPVTILSRCLQFNLKNLAPKRIVDYLQMVLEAEGITSEEPALWHLANAAGGSMRDALTLLDQAISFGEGQVRESAVVDLLGTPDQRVIFGLAEALRDHDAQALMDGIASLADNNPDYRRQLEQLLSLFHRVAIAQAVPEALDNSQGDRKAVLALAGELPAEDVQLWYQIALQTVQDMTVAVDRRMVFEMGLLRMLAFTPDPGGMSTEPREQVTGEKKKPELREPSTPSVEQTSQESPAPVQPEPEPEPEPEPQPQGISLAQLDSRNWTEVVDALGLSGVAGNVLANCALQNCIANELLLALDPGQSALYRPEEHDRLFAQALGGYFGQPVTVHIEVSAPANESPAARRQRLKRERAESALRHFSNDPGVREIMDRFNARLDESSLQYSDER
ncbi:MAG: DNA polymerase III subunit gamma/tau [Pseudohongiellaceae bacterium]